MSQDYETSKNTGGQMTPAPARQPAPPAPLSEAERQANTDKLMNASADRQHARGKAEQDARKLREAEDALILQSAKALHQKHPRLSVHALWMFISAGGLTPRVATADLFIHRIWELAHSNALKVIEGNPSSTPTKIIIVPQEFRID